MVFGDRLAAVATSAGITHFHQLEQLEAARPTDRAQHAAGAHALDFIGEGVRDFIQAAPAKVAALQCIGTVRITDGRSLEVELALVQQRLDAVHLALAGGDLLGGRAFGQGDQDVGQVVLGAAGALLGERGVHFTFADADAALRETLAQALGDDFLAHRVAEVGEANAVLGKALAQAVDRGAVLLGDAVDGVVEFLVANPDATAVGTGDLQLDQHQALEHLPLQYRFGRQLGFTPCVLALDVVDRTLQLALQDHVLIDDGGDAVQRLALLGKGRSGNTGKRQQGGEDSRKGLGHGIRLGS